MPTDSAYRRRVLDAELDELMRALPAIAVEGPKGVGKTATASQRATTVHELDDPDQRALAEADPARLLEDPPPVLIDEWQFVPPVWDGVRRAVDAGAGPGQFLLTGSSSPVEGGTHSGAARVVTLRMRPLALAERGPEHPTVSLAELLRGERPSLRGSSEMGLEHYTDEILRSGFPGLRGMDGRSLRMQLDGYLQRIVDRDFPELGHPIRNPALLRRWMAAYAAATATSTSFAKVRAAATGREEDQPAKTTAAAYRDVLERLFILDDVPAWQHSRNLVAQLALPPKHHLADPALAARLLGATRDALLRGESPGPRVPRDGTLLGALFESLVTLSVRVYAQAAEAEVRHLRTRGGRHEVDLIVQRDDGKVVAIEVKLGKTPRPGETKHLTWLAEELGDDLLDALVVTTGSNAYRREDGIAVVPAALLGP
jgi:predicted AAA+ superfamily ATPase